MVAPAVTIPQFKKALRQRFHRQIALQANVLNYSQIHLSNISDSQQLQIRIESPPQTRRFCSVTSKMPILNKVIFEF
jgi:hypothetical protein